MKEIDFLCINLSKVLDIVDRELKRCSSNFKVKLDLNLKLFEIDRVIRPALVVISSRMYNGQREKTISLASIIQLTHIASRIHSLIEDKEIKVSTLRRQYSVLVGDYIYSRSYKLLHDADLSCFLYQMATIIDNMSDGGVVSILDPASEMEIIKKETAQLFGGACSMGAALGKATKNECKLLKTYGLALGMIYGMNERDIEYEEMREYIDTALNVLTELPDSPLRELMEQLIYVCAGHNRSSFFKRYFTLPA